MAMRNKSLLILLTIIGVSVVLRVGTAFYLGNEIDAPPLLTDQRSYDALGARLITGHEFSFDRGWYPFTRPDEPTAHWSFLYSLFVAIVYAIFGPSPLAARLIQAILGGILLPLIIYRLNRTIIRAAKAESTLKQHGLDPEVLPLIAAGLSAIYLFFVLYAATVMTETFYIVALLWSLDQTIRLAEKPSLKNGAALGVAIGITTLLRQSVLPWIVVAALWLLWTGYQTRAIRRVVLPLAATAAILVLMILPFTLRNYRVYGQFLLLNSNAGYAMFSAQHPMHGTTFQEFEAAPVPEELLNLNEAQLDRELMQRGLGFVLAEPGRYALLSLSRVADYFEFWPTPDTSVLHNLGRVGSFGLLLPFLVYGMWLALRWFGPRAAGGWRAFSTTPWALLLLFIGIYSVLHILTWAMPRYRLPVDAVALSFAALAIANLASLISEKMRSKQKYRRDTEQSLPAGESD
jgi:hypothetical protein